MKTIIKEWVLLPIVGAVAVFTFSAIAGLGFSYGYILNKEKVLFVYMKDDPVSKVTEELPPLTSEE